MSVARCGAKPPIDSRISLRDEEAWNIGPYSVPKFTKTASELFMAARSRFGDMACWDLKLYCTDMIPGPSDAALADIENTAGSIRVKLTTIQYGDPAHRDIAGLRQLRQDYVDMVMKFAKDVGR
jgi:hypothetical protein